MEGENFIILDFYDIFNVFQVIFVDDNVICCCIFGIFYDGQLSFWDYFYFSFIGCWDWFLILFVIELFFFYDSYSLGFVFIELLGLAMNLIFFFGKLCFFYVCIGKDVFVYVLDNFFVFGSLVKG